MRSANLKTTAGSIGHRLISAQRKAEVKDEAACRLKSHFTESFTYAITHPHGRGRQEEGRVLFAKRGRRRPLDKRGFVDRGKIYSRNLAQ
ncbi:unnamed protein product [Lota lota]